MGIFSNLFSKDQLNVNTPENMSEGQIRDVDFKSFEVGSSGTEIYSGYLSEEYLDTLRGTQKADAFDKMRRSDPKIRMILSAMKNPIKAANWEVVVKGDTNEQAEKQKELIEHILFNDLGKSWTKFLHEALSMIDFGYSLFEITYKPVLNHKELGSYVGIKRLGFRSQRSIERWKIGQDKELLAVEQQAYGDGQTNTDIPAEYLMHFALDQEGDNFEGISILRPCFGPWSRKNLFLKYIAVGIEKYAIPIPVLDVPEGKEKTEQYEMAKKALQRYVSNACNYLIKPKGWDLELKPNPFDAKKVRDIVNEENVEMVNAALANFLELGQSGSGSYSLSFDLSNFFLGALEFIAKEICDEFNQNLIPKLIEANFSGEQQVELKCSGISDKAGEELARSLALLIKSNVVEPDGRLEESMRKRFGLPEKEEATTREVPEETGPLQFAEKKKTTIEKDIDKGQEQIKLTLEQNLEGIRDQMLDVAINHFEKSTETTKFKLPKLSGKVKNINKFKKELRETYSDVYVSSFERVSKNNKKLDNVKLAEIDKLGTKSKNFVTSQADTLNESLVNDLEKTISLQYNQSAGSTDSPSLLRQDLKESSNKYVSGGLILTAAGIGAATLTNAARSEFFSQNEDEIESYTWINQDPQAEICQYLAGRTLPADHPDVDRYQPPLHHNCKTYLTANIKGAKGNPEPESGLNPNQKQMKSITLKEKTCKGENIC